MMSNTSQDDVTFSEVQLRCGTCNAYVDSEDLFCSNCGAEAPEIGHKIPSTGKFKQSFGCNGCGASMNYDANVQTLACPFCGNQKVEKEKLHRSVEPEWVIPFRIDKQLAEKTLKAWMGKSFWRPNDLASTSSVTKMTAVYVPYWCFKAITKTYWTADSSDVPWSSRSGWRPISGDHSADYDGVLVGASSALTAHETNGICPFYMDDSRPFESFPIGNQIIELAKVPRKFARPQARLLLEQNERNACRKYVPGRCRNMKVNVRLHSLEGRVVLLPIWILTYHYKNKPYRFLINGQTNQCIGQGPTSYWKLFLILGGIIGGIAFIMLIMSIIGLIAAV